MMKLDRIISQVVFRTRRNCDKIMKEFSRNVVNKTILEIGSGKKVNGKYIYSYKNFFDKSNCFIRSDIDPEYGHKVVDITKMMIKSKWDIIICLNVLEHIYDFKAAVKNLHRALKKNGTLIYFGPYIYPLHDIPHDYFRFSEFALRRMFSSFSKYEIRQFGLRRFPTGY